MEPKPDLLESAMILYASVLAALANGVLHYSTDGRLLQTPKEIVDVLAAEGQIIYDVSQRQPVTTDEEMLAAIKKAFEAGTRNDSPPTV